jgi:hypothetical protein
MSYSLMLLADPGTERERVLQVLASAPDIEPDRDVETRYRLRTPQGEAEVNIGTKDPIESVHVEFEMDRVELMDAVARRFLQLARELGMRMEDVQWGHEVTEANLPELLSHFRDLRSRPQTETVPEARRPWWRVW